MKLLFRVILMMLLVLVGGCGQKEEKSSATIEKKEVSLKRETMPSKQREEGVSRTGRNHPPRILQAHLLPAFPKAGDVLKIEVKADDPDEDEVSLNFKWFVNDELVKEDTEELSYPLKRGDKVKVEIIASDGEAQTSYKIYAIVQNTPPKIEGLEEIAFDGQIYQAKILAQDADGDNLSFSLLKPQEGIEISEDGVLTWDTTKLPPPVRISIKAEDSTGSASIYTATLEVKK